MPPSARAERADPDSDSWQVHRLSAVAGSKLRKKRGANGVLQKANRAVGEGKCATAGMDAPKMIHIAIIVDFAGPKKRDAAARLPLIFGDGVAAADGPQDAIEIVKRPPAPVQG